MKWLYVLSLVYCITLAITYGAGQLNLDFIKVFSNVLFPTTAAAAAAVSFLTLDKYAKHNPRPPFSAAWTSFSSGIVLWSLGELTWAIYVLFLMWEPFPSLADVFYLGGYVFLFIALFLILNLFKQAFSPKVGGITTIVSVFLAVAVFYSLVTPIFTSSEDLLATILAVSYPILNIGMFALAFATLLIFLEGTIGKAWFFVTVGIIMNIAADLLFSYAELQGFYYEGHPFELFWLWGYVAFLLGFYIHRREF